MTHELDAKRLDLAIDAFLNKPKGKGGLQWQYKKRVGAAIRAYIGDAEPVGWQYRYRYSHDGAWSKWQAVRLEKADYVEEERRPIFSAPPSPSVEELVRAAQMAEREIEKRIRRGLATDAEMSDHQVSMLVDTNPAIVALRAALSRVRS